MRSANHSVAVCHMCTVFVFMFILFNYLAIKFPCESFLDRPSVNALQPAPSRSHVLVTGGAGYIGSHATKKLLEEGYAVTIIDNLSRGNIGAIDALRRIAPPGRLRFFEADLADSQQLNTVLRESAIDVVMHFAAVAYVGAARLLSTVKAALTILHSYVMSMD